MPVKKISKKRITVKKGEVPIAPLGEPGAVPLLLYRRIAVTFMFVVAAALLTILYLSTVQAVIHINSTQTPLGAEFITDVLPNPTQETDVRGAIAVGTLGRTQTFQASGESKKQIDGIATGEVVITNNLSFAQPLVENTRLLSPEGVLFRLKNGVTVPAGGSVSVMVYADEPGAGGDIQPTGFTIPGLSAARQVSVFAQSSTAFTGGVSEVAVVLKEEIDASVVVLTNTLVSDALAMLKEEVGDTYTGVASSVEEIERVVSIEPGTEAAQYDVNLSLKIAAVFYDKEALREIAVRKLYESLGQGQTFASVGADAMSVEVALYDETTQHANVRVVLSGIAISAQTNEALDVGRFVGLGEEEVRALLINDGIATSVNVEFFPFWVKTIPRLKDHIYIDIR
jgi:hypothetical protein